MSQIGLTITFLAYQAWLMSDAISAHPCPPMDHAQKFARVGDCGPDQECGGPEPVWESSGEWPAASCCALAAFVAVGLVQHQAMPVALPFILLWAASPAIARWISEPPRLRRDGARFLQRSTNLAIGFEANMAFL